MMATPSGRLSSEPGPAASASGKAPSRDASVVIRMGRKRSRHASWIACSGVRRRCRSASSAKSTSMMPFFLTMPISSMMPISAMIDGSRSKMRSAISAPRPADGSVEMMVSGWARLSYRTPSTM